MLTTDYTDNRDKTSKLLAGSAGVSPASSRPERAGETPALPVQ
jgi:hypothetical protein